MTNAFTATRLWQDARQIPEVLAATLDERQGFDELAGLLGADSTRRVVVTGNGAAYYVGLTLQCAALVGGAGPEVLALPAGVLAGGDMTWREGDVVLVVSSSGELRDVLAVRDRLPRPLAVVTATPGSSIGRDADVLAVTRVRSTSGATHTQSLLANHAAVLAVWAEVTADRGLHDAVSATSHLCAAALEAAPTWIDRALADVDVPSAATVFGTGAAWPAALEAALLLKEVAGVPAEGMETREGATSGMYALRRGHLAVGLPSGPHDPLAEEALQVCRGTGATVVTLPDGPSGDRRVASLTSFPAALALAATLGGRAGIDVDDPDWQAAYYATTRLPGTP